MRRITQQLLTEVLDALEFVAAKHIETCRIVTGLAEQMPPSDLANAILQNTAMAEFDIYRQIQLMNNERTNIAVTSTRNNWLRRRREERAEWATMPDDDLDIALGERGLPTPDLVDE